jgi:hypothetical protein
LGKGLKQLRRDEALRLLGSISIGRIVSTMGGLPTVPPVNHVVDIGDVVIRARVGLAEL